MSNYKVCLCLRALSRICFKSIRSYKWTSACKKTTVYLNQNNVHTSSGNDRPHTLSQLQSRSLIELSGKDTIDFLQGLVTNDVNQLAEKSPSTQYSMILNVQGRVLYDLFLYNSSSENKTTILIDIDKAGKDEVLKLFKRYRLRKKVDVIDISDGYKVWCQFNSSAIPDTLKPPLTFHDPRVPLFGCRFLSDKSVNETANANVVDEEEYTTWRYRWGIPEGVTDLPPGNCLPLESNLALMNGVNFQKGCYIGQELTARTFHTGVIRKRIVPLQLEFPADIECDATITTKEKGKNAGKFRSAKGIYGLGLLRMAHLKDELVVMDKDGKSVPVTPHVPDWWPHSIV